MGHRDGGSPTALRADEFWEACIDGRSERAAQAPELAATRIREPSGSGGFHGSGKVRRFKRL